MTAFYRSGREQGGSFDHGIEAVIQRLLTDPDFIYRTEIEPAKQRVGLPTGSAISSWRHACRSSCGAAFPTWN